MKRTATSWFAAAVMIAGIAGCSRTVEDVLKWESKNNTEKITDALTDPKFEVRHASAEALGRLRPSNVEGALAACLNDSEEQVRLAAIDALYAIGTPDTIMPLIAAFKLSSRDARLKAAEALGTLKAVAAIEVLAEGLHDADEAVRIAAAEALGRIGSMTGSRPLAGRLADTSSSLKVRMACIAALVRTGGPVAYDALVQALADDDVQIREEANTVLLGIGRPAIPSVLEGLKSSNAPIRSASIQLLHALSAVPAEGSDLVWYELARTSLDGDAGLRAEVIARLADQGESVVPTLIEAASLKAPEIREIAVQTLERIGEPARAAAMAAADRIGKSGIKEWMKSRKDWAGAPSPLLDLYAAVSALNPDFPQPADAKTLLRSDAPPQRAWIPLLISHLNHADDRGLTIRLLKSAGPAASLPLIAALGSPDTAIVEAAAVILSDRRDTRALHPLMDAVQSRFDAGEFLSQSALYSSLLEMDRPEAEAVLLNIRPNTERAIQVFSRKYRGARVIAVETTDRYTDHEVPIAFRIAYLDNGNPGTLEITFRKDTEGCWHPAPDLPDALP